MDVLAEIWYNERSSFGCSEPNTSREEPLGTRRISAAFRRLFERALHFKPEVFRMWWRLELPGGAFTFGSTKPRLLEYIDDLYKRQSTCILTWHDTEKDLHSSPSDGGSQLPQKGEKMPHWRLTVGGTVREGESFTPLRGLLDKLVSQRCPFKVGFGEEIEVTLPPEKRRYPEDIPSPAGREVPQVEYAEED